MLAAGMSLTKACAADTNHAHATAPVLLCSRTPLLAVMQTRSNAIEHFQQGLANLGPLQTQVLLQQLPEFSAFVLQLLADHNFKVVIAGLSVLADAARSLRQALHQRMG
jgi:hypothetical protein